MRIDLDPALFPAGAVNPIELADLLTTAVRKGHTLAAPQAASGAWCHRQGDQEPAWQSLLDEHRARLPLMRQGVRRIRVTAGPSDWPSGALSLVHATRLLVRPLELLLENERGDWPFLRRLADTGARAELDEALARERLQLRHGGGVTDICNAVKAMFGPPQNVAKQTRRLRTWVLFDRDANTTDARQPGGDNHRAAAACRRRHPADPWPIAWHRLSRRHIESYLPTDVLRHAAQDAPETARIDALARLRAADEPAADSLHMKRGLFTAIMGVGGQPQKTIRKLVGEDRSHSDPGVRAAAERRVPPAAWRPPFDAVPAADRAELLRGFGHRIADLFSSAPPAYDAAFPAEFDKRETDASGQPLTAIALIESILDRL